MSPTRIVATIGPVTNSAQTLSSLARAGMSTVRLNASHNTLAWHGDTITLVKRVLPETPILLDVPGRKVRTAHLASEPAFAVGDLITLTTEEGHDGREKVSIGSRRLHLDVSPCDTLLADDGKLRFTVVDVLGRDIHCRAEVAGRLRSRKGINLPGKRTPAPHRSHWFHWFHWFQKYLELPYNPPAPPAVSCSPTSL